MSLMRSSPPVTPASAMNDPISMWSGPIWCSQPWRSARPETVRTLEPIPWMSRAHLLQHPREVLDVRLARGVADDGRAGGPRGGQQRVLRAHDGRLVHEDVAARRPCGARRSMSRLKWKSRPEGAERVQVRIEPAATDHVTARRRHHGAAEARQQRAREQERRADALRQRRGRPPRSRGRGRRRRARPRSRRATRRATPMRVEQPEHRLDVLDARHVADDDLVLA